MGNRSKNLANQAEFYGVVSISGVILYASPFHQNYLDVPLKEFIGSNGYERVHPEDLSKVERMIFEVISSNQSKEIKYRYRLRSEGWDRFDATLVPHERKGKMRSVGFYSNLCPVVDLKELMRYAQKM